MGIMKCYLLRIATISRIDDQIVLYAICCTDLFLQEDAKCKAKRDDDISSKDGKGRKRDKDRSPQRSRSRSRSR